MGRHKIKDTTFSHISRPQEKTKVTKIVPMDGYYGYHLPAGRDTPTSSLKTSNVSKYNEKKLNNTAPPYAGFTDPARVTLSPRPSPRVKVDRSMQTTGVTQTEPVYVVYEPKVTPTIVKATRQVGLERLYIHRPCLAFHKDLLHKCPTWAVLYES